MATAPNSFVRLLAEQGLRNDKQAAEIAGKLLPRFTKTEELTAELVRLGYLSEYQGGCLLEGRVKDLVVGPYRLLDRLGEGGMGEVFKARHLRMDRIVALKFIQQERAVARGKGNCGLECSCLPARALLC